MGEAEAADGPRQLLDDPGREGLLEDRQEALLAEVG